MNHLGQLKQVKLSPIVSALYGSKRFVEYQPGNLNVVLSCSHDGNLLPDYIPDRIPGYVCDKTTIFSHSLTEKLGTCERAPIMTCRELYTLDLTLNLAAELETLTGQRPHVVINHLHRCKLDPNREVGEATFGVPDAVLAYNEFHKFISLAKRSVVGPGVLIDIHGQTHAEGWVELGYLLTKPQLNSAHYKSQHSSVFSLAQRIQRQHSIKNIIAGHNSLGGLLQDEGYRVIPSPKYEHPGSGKYFRGGYITRTHGSYYGGNIDAIQIESPRFLYDGEQAVLYTKSLGRAIHRFLHLYYSHRQQCDTGPSDSNSL